MTTSAVIILVSDAIGSTRVGWWRQSTRPVSMSNMRPDRGMCLKRARTGSPPWSRRTDSGDGAVPPPASGSRSSAPVVCRGGAVRFAEPPPSRCSTTSSTAAAATASSATIASTAGARLRRRLRPPWKSV